ncbi:MAG: hypothetical protein PHG23_01260 [Candidatus Pacebacteria bacterium]|nr:hypothetical protein [Candidatus Paceibacterota bacterium]
MLLTPLIGPSIILHVGIITVRESFNKAKKITARLANIENIFIVAIVSVFVLGTASVIVYVSANEEHSSIHLVQTYVAEIRREYKVNVNKLNKTAMLTEIGGADNIKTVYEDVSRASNSVFNYFKSDDWTISLVKADDLDEELKKYNYSLNEEQNRQTLIQFVILNRPTVDQNNEFGGR